MSNCKIVYDNQGNKIGVSENNQLFQEILNNPLNKDFDSALEIFLETYSGEFELNANNINGFYSNAEQSLLNLKDKNPKNVKGWISQLTDTQKNGGIKNVNQELEWIGLEDYLNDYVKENNPKAGNIPSSVVEEYIKLNQIEIVDVSKGVKTLNNDVFDIKFEEGEFIVTRNGEYEISFDNEDIANDYIAMTEIRDESDQVKYSGYQLKGASNYREVLLTMPPSINKEYEKELIKRYGEGNYYNMASYEERDRLYRGVYKSSHWDEKNILAHVRMNEKTLPDGRRVLIINEIQSDSGQAIKKDEDFILKEIENNFDNIYNKLLKSGIIKEDC